MLYLLSSEALAPFIMSCLTMATCPFKQAKCRGVFPSAFLAPGSCTAETGQYITARF